MKALYCTLMLALLAPVRGATALPLDPALTDREWLLETLLYSYYWYLDDAFFAEQAENKDAELWVRSIEPRTRDADDRSRFGQVWLPGAKVLLTVKQADYQIPELNLTARTASYRVVRGSFEAAAPAAADAWKFVPFSWSDIAETFRSARHQVHVPGPATKEVVQTMLRREMKRAGVTSGPQRFYIAARTAVATEVWVLWQNRRTIFQISGDMDITDRAAVSQLPLLIRQFNLGTNVVASLLEAQASNAVISRDRASRVLFMCLARGEEIVMEPEAPLETPPR
jgi:hypothetical protein